MKYTSTRDGKTTISAQEAILKGLAPDGGLFVPLDIQPIDIASLQGKSYVEIALAVIRGFLPEYDGAFLQTALEKSYGENFENKAGHLVKLQDGLFSLELWHGPTAAFKDYALQLMPHLLAEARRMLNEQSRTVILVATSGDTGKAALEGYKNLHGIDIAVFYPSMGTSEIQRLQMATQEGDNVAVYAVEGNFDDAQRGVKLAFADAALAKAMAQKKTALSSANSINWGRLVPQIVYYATSYLHLCQTGDISMGQELDFCVPTGNFGDIMAGYYAKKLGVPVGRLICASNRNNVLSDFLHTGHYNSKRDFHKTSSPSMDILISSNLERLLYHESGSVAKVGEWMGALAQTGSYQVDADVLQSIRKTFSAGWVDEDDVGREIRSVYEKYGYLCDPHTAVAFKVHKNFNLQGRDRPTVVISTASPFKFSGKVLLALGQPVPQDEFEALRKLEQISGQPVPESLSALQGKPIRFTQSILPQDIPIIPLTL